jgi:hypothetical protein
MPVGYRVLARSGEPLGDAATIDDVLGLAMAAPPGRYRVIKYFLDRTAGDLRCWQLGSVTRDRWRGIRLHLPPVARNDGYARR